MSAVETAIKMETDAIQFYTEAAAKCSHEAGKKMLLSVVEDEKAHLKALKDLFEGFDKSYDGRDPMGSINTVFSDLKDKMTEKIAASDDELEAFRVAMTMEDEGRDYYLKAAGEASDEREKNLFNILAEEELKHYKAFANTYNFLNDTGNWFMWEERSIVEG